MGEIGDTPFYLGAPIAFIAQRKIAWLYPCAIALPWPPCSMVTELIGRNHAPASFGMRCFEPAHQGRSKIEIDVGVIIYDALDLAAPIYDSRERVGPVAFGIDPLIPIVKRPRAILAIDRAGPRILPRRLIEMAVNYYRGHARLSSTKGW